MLRMPRRTHQHEVDFLETSTLDLWRICNLQIYSLPLRVYVLILASDIRISAPSLQSLSHRPLVNIACPFHTEKIEEYVITWNYNECCGNRKGEIGTLGVIV